MANAGGGGGPRLKAARFMARIRFSEFPCLPEKGWMKPTLFTLIITLASVTSGFWTGFSAPTETEIVHHFSMSKTQFAFLASVPSLGAVLGTLGGIWCAERIGRRISVFLGCIFSLVGYVMMVSDKHSVVLLIVGRAIVGVGGGWIVYPIPTYIREMTTMGYDLPEGLVPKLLAINQVALSLGTLLAYFVGIWIKWKLLAFIGSLPSIFLLVLIWCIPETLNLDAAPPVRRRINMARFKWLLLGAGIFIFQQATGVNAFLSYATTLFTRTGVPDIKMMVSLLGLSQFILTLLGLAVPLKYMRLILLISTCGMTFALIPTMVGFFLKGKAATSSRPWTCFFGLLASVGFYSLGMNSVPWVFLMDVCDDDFRTYAVAIASFLRSLTSFGVTIGFEFALKKNAGGDHNLFIIINLYLIRLLLCLIFFMVILPLHLRHSWAFL